MADVNWNRFRCNLCLMLGLAAASVVAAAIAWLLIGAGVPVALAIVIFFIVWAILGLVVDKHCAGRAQNAARAAPAAAGSGISDRSNDDAAHGVATVAAAAPAATASETPVTESPVTEAAVTEAAVAEAPVTEAPARAAPAAAAEPAANDTVNDDPGEADGVDRDGDGVIEGKDEGTKPTTLSAARGGQADDLKRIKGIGPKLEQVCHDLGFFHFDQIAAWTDDEVAWVDSNLEGFKGRVTRDDWVAQAKVLAEGGETEFSKRVDEGDVPSSQ